MVLVWLLLFFCSPKVISAQVPLFYQLTEAYQPSSYQTTLSLAQPVETASIAAAPAVLGTSTTSPTVSIPKNIGGDGKITTIAVLGDSMIDTLGPGIPQLKNSLKKYFPNQIFNILNYGVGSRDIEYGLYRLTNNYEYLNQQVNNLISQHPDIIVIESFAYNNFGNTQKGIDRHWLAMGAITSTIKNKLPNTKIVMASTISPNSIVFANGVKDLHLSSMDKIEKANTIKLYLQNTINFAKSEGYPLADAYHLSLVNNDGSREFINSVDNLHPSASGATLFSDIVADTISHFKLLD